MQESDREMKAMPVLPSTNTVNAGRDDDMATLTERTLKSRQSRTEEKEDKEAKDSVIVSPINTSHLSWL
jgi:hypothetical protein